MCKKIMPVTAILTADSGMAVSQPKYEISIAPADINDPVAMKRFNKAVSDQKGAFNRAKRERPEILEAIIAARGRGPVEQPWTTAGTNLTKVNAWLLSHGHDRPATKKGVYDRLNRFPRS